MSPSLSHAWLWARCSPGSVGYKHTPLFWGSGSPYLHTPPAGTCVTHILGVFMRTCAAPYDWLRHVPQVPLHTWGVGPRWLYPKLPPGREPMPSGWCRSKILEWWLLAVSNQVGLLLCACSKVSPPTTNFHPSFLLPFNLTLFQKSFGSPWLSLNLCNSCLEQTSLLLFLLF